MWCLTHLFGIPILGAMTDDELLTAPRVASILSVSDETVRRWADRGLIRSIRLPSGQRRFRRSDVDALLNPEPTEGAA